MGSWGVSETCRLLGLTVLNVPGIHELIGILRSRSIAAALRGCAGRHNILLDHRILQLV